MILSLKNSAANTKNVVTMLHTSDGKVAILEAFHFSEEAETGEKLAEVVDKSIVIAQNKYNVEIFGIVSDNANDMVKMGKMVGLIHTTCSSHIANLLAKDIVEHELVTSVTNVLKGFKSPDMERELLNTNGHRIVLPCDTRWGSHKQSLESFLKNVQFMQRLATKHFVKSNVKKLLFDDEFIQNVREYLDILTPIAVLINKCQQRQFSIADATEEWLKLQLRVRFKAVVEKRKEMALNIYSLTANFLHLEYMGKLLSIEQRSRVKQYLLRKALEYLNSFINKEGVSEILCIKKLSSPLVYWSLAEENHPSLAMFAKKLLQIPASSAQLERIFSN